MGRLLRSFFPLLTIVALFVSLVSVVSSAEIAVKPGRFDHFDLSAPMRVVAGQDAEIRLQAKDAFNNVIPAFGEAGKEFSVTVTGTAVVTPEGFSSASFKDGAFSLKLMDKAAQTVTLTIMEKGSSIPVVLKELTVVPTTLNSFEVMGPKTAVAGERFLIHISAKDSYGNTVTEPLGSKDLALSFKAASGQKVEAVSMSDFAQGFAVATFFSEKVGAITIEVKDQRTGKVGASGEIHIVNGPVHSFRITAPDEVMQGESFGVTLEALDRFGNPVVDYANSGKRVELTTSSKTKPIHQTITAQSFTEGRGSAVLTYEGSDKEISLLAAESGRQEKSKGKAMSVIAPVPARIEVATPSTAVAGEKFKIQVTVYNQKGNVFKNFSTLGRDVFLRTTGRGELIPNRIRSSKFVGGTAVEEVLYNRSENFTITADTPGMKLPEPPVAAAPKPEKKAEKPAPQPVVRKEEPKKEEPKTGLPVWEGAKKELPKKEEKKAPAEKKAEVKKSAPAPAVPPAPAVTAPASVPVPEPVVTFAPVPAPPVKEAKAPEAVQKKPELQKKEKPEEVAALKPEKPKMERKPEKAPEKAKEEPRKLSKKVKPLEVSSLSVIETEEKTLILIHVPNLSESGEGRTSVETAGDKIILKLSPAVNKLDRMAQFDSAYVKNVTVEEDRKGTTIVKVELTKPVQYQLKEGKTSIVLTLSH